MFNVFHYPGSDWQEGGHLRQKEIEKVPSMVSHRGPMCWTDFSSRTHRSIEILIRRCRYNFTTWLFGGKWVSTFSLLLRPGPTEEDGAPNMWQKTYFKAIILENIKIEEVTYKPRPLPPLGSFHSLAVEKKWRDLWLAAGSHWITTFYHNFSQDHF